MCIRDRDWFISTLLTEWVVVVGFDVATGFVSFNFINTAELVAAVKPSSHDKPSAITWRISWCYVA